MSSVNGKTNGALTGQQYWRSLEHLADTPEFREFMYREFPAGATDLLDSQERRSFLKIMGASMALAGMGLAGCRRWPDEHIMPYTSRPVGRTPGVPVQYATCMDLGGVASALLVSSFDGRPVKIEGNPEHPVSQGAADLFAQASILDLYDPDRSQSIRKRVKSEQGETNVKLEPASRQEFEQWVASHFASHRGNGAGLAVLSESSSSPSVHRMKKRLMEACPGTRWFEYDAVNNDSEIEASIASFGSPYQTNLNLTNAKVIVSLDSDFLGSDRNNVANIRAFAENRRGENWDKVISRMYAFESEFSLTGANADTRIAIRSSDIPVIAGYLAVRILAEESPYQFERDAAGEAILTDELKAVLDRAIADLQSREGECLIVAGPRQPAEVHHLVYRMNDRLNAAGNTVTYSPRPDRMPSAKSLAEFASEVESGSITTLLMLGGNPALTAPADVDVKSLIERIDNSVHLGDYVDETARACTWHVNRAHYLESWGDGRAADGTYSVCQPLIEPLFDGLSAIELLAMIVGDHDTSGQSIVRSTFGSISIDASDKAWKKTLHDGFLASSMAPAELPTVDRRIFNDMVNSLFAKWKAANGAGGWELVFAPHPTIYDGRFANNGWLQELPDPITKLTWDNAVLMSPAMWNEMGLEGDPHNKIHPMVEVSVGGKSVKAAAMRVPGLPSRTVVLHLGYNPNRAFEGRVSTGAGFDFGSLRTSATMGFVTGAQIAKTSGTYVLATTQDHHTIDTSSVGGTSAQERLPSLFREATSAEYKANPTFANDHHHNKTHVVHRLSLWEEDNLESANYRWGMTIDLTACVGCGACVVACQAENNIPIVGKDQVKRGREMHWIRIDRYFRFKPIEPEDHGGHHAAETWDPNVVEAVALQPVNCMMCENAPCEQVCPVAATLHDKDGLNVMVYNRCVGTRYCSNNCPYKVRRFNYFDYHRRAAHREQPGTLMQVDPEYYTKKQATPDGMLAMQFNPEVSVRMRGVMEKCTYCIQRISAARIEAKNNFAKMDEHAKEAHGDARIPIPDGAITPACAQTCPAQAIVFGDLADRNSRVYKLQAHDRCYEMLEELNVDARTKYLAKLRNPAPIGVAAAGSGHERHEH